MNAVLAPNNMEAETTALFIVVLNVHIERAGLTLARVIDSYFQGDLSCCYATKKEQYL